jgi:hypothetical protein
MKYIGGIYGRIGKRYFLVATTDDLDKAIDIAFKAGTSWVMFSEGKTKEQFLEDYLNKHDLSQFS